MTFEKYHQTLTSALKTLYEAGEARAIARVVLEHLTNDKYRLMASLPMPENLLQKTQLIQAELLMGKPVQYVLGEAWFLGRKFLMNESVLIPRPETEELVILAIETIRKKGLLTRDLKILDIGTGSGCIAISLALELKDAMVTGIDISTDAVEVAAQNSQKLEAKVNWQQADFLNTASWEAFSNIKVIVSNPPYIPLAEKAILEKNVTDWEPSIALFTPDEDPFVFYKAIALFCKNYPLEGRMVVLEGHQQYMQDLQAIFSGIFGEVVIQKDIHGNERMLLAQ